MGGTRAGELLVLPAAADADVSLGWQCAAVLVMVLYVRRISMWLCVRCVVWVCRVVRSVPLPCDQATPARWPPQVLVKALSRGPWCHVSVFHLV